ncbi:MAG: hypothetical protein ACFCVE_09800 [Phycisphaerae bacterium]
MIQTVTHDPSATARPFLSEVAPLNVQRRDDALYLLATEYGRPLTQYEVCKTVVLSDVLHVIETGRVIFGGSLVALPYGPIIDGTFDACRSWARGGVAAALMAPWVSSPSAPLHKSGTMPGREHVSIFVAADDYGRRSEASWDGFAADEQRHIREAYSRVIGMTFGDSQRYFHEPVSAIGYAYEVATRPFDKPFRGSVAMNWFDMLDGAERIERVDVGYARDLLGLWV